MNMTKVGAIAVAMLAGALVGYVICQMLLGLQPAVGNAVGIGASAGVAFALMRKA